MKDKIDAIKSQALDEIKNADNKQLENIRVKYLGKKGALTLVLREMGSLPDKERPIIGQLANEVRSLLESALEAARAAILEQQQKQALIKESIDVTMPGKRKRLGHKHPISIVTDQLTDIFIGMGFTIAEGPEIETDYYNFEALNTPKNHPARDVQDTFYITDNILLRTQTSPVQIRTMEISKPPIKIIAPGAVYRSDTVDATHSPLFHQLEGLVVDKGITMSDLKGTLETFVKSLYGNDVSTRFRPHHFPFTEPSGELDVSCFVCNGKGCGVCKGEGFIELLGCGMVHPKVLSVCGINPDVYSGFAFGIGLERVAMRKFNINDMRLFYENDVRFLSQF